MNSITNSKIFLCNLLLVLTTLLHPCFSRQAEADEPRPNIVLIMADDLSHKNLSCYGATNFQTPNLDRLAATGMRFEHCYSMPLCTPSRVMLMTGQHNGRNFLRASTLEADQRTFGHVAKEVGYETCVVGKWKLTGKSKESTPDRFGFDEHYVTEGLRNDSPRYKNPEILKNGKQVKYSGGEYGPDIVCDHAIDFIERKKNEPFLLYYPMVLVHSPLSPVPGSPGYDAADQRTDDKVNYPAMIRRMDDNVGRIVAKLDAMGLRERTIILFTGDNGTKNAIEMKLNDGSIYSGGKGSTRDNGVHVPLIVNQLGRVPVGVSEALVGFADFLPTVADIAGGKLEANIPCDGQSFLPQCLGKPNAAVRESIYQWFSNNPQQDKLVEVAFDQDFRLYGDGSFFNWSSDISESKPLAVDSLKAGAKKAYEKLVKSLQTHREGVNRAIQPKNSAAADVSTVAPRNSIEAQATPSLTSLETRPNILWIVTDDQRSDSIAAFNRIRRNGHPDSALGHVLSPNVDRLASMGTTFINTFNQNPCCQPSRTIMHTGRYSHRTGVYGFEYHNPTGMKHWKPMVPEILRDEAGYQTITIGKLGLYAQHFVRKNNPNGQVLYETNLGYRDEFAAKGLVDWHSEKARSGGKAGPKTETFHFADGKTLFWREQPGAAGDDSKAIRERLGLFRAYDFDSGNGTVKVAGKLDVGDEGGGGEILGGLNPQASNKTRDASFSSAMLDHLSNVGREYTDSLGRKQSGQDSTKPIFIHCGFEFPHTPVLPPAEFREKFSKLHYELPKFTEAERAQFPPQTEKFFKQWATNHFSDAEKQQMVADYYAYCAYGDSLVGRLADGFIQYSEANERPWLILYVCGDNGWKLNEHGMGAKFLHYDEDLHNPIIVISSDKQRFPAGKVVIDFTGFVDMAPTFLAAAGIDVSSPQYNYLDGRDLAQTAAGERRPRDYIIAEPTWVIGPRAVIRTKDYKFAMRVRPHSGNAVTKATCGKDIDWAMKADLNDIEPTLFDLRIDPAETNNLAYDPRYREVLDTMRTKLQNIVLGDSRVEVAWSKDVGDEVHISNFAPGADDGKLTLPELAKATN